MIAAGILGAGQRSDVLYDSLGQIQIKPNTNGCVVASGPSRRGHRTELGLPADRGTTEVVA